MGYTGRGAGRATGVQYLTNPINIVVGGDVSGNTSFNGLTDVDITATVRNADCLDGQHGSYYASQASVDDAELFALIGI